MDGIRERSLDSNVAVAEAPGLPAYDWDDILRHDKAGDFWIVFRGGVYDVSEWMYRHPGGAKILIEAWGQDATDFFNSIGHSDEARLLTQSFKVGLVKEGSRPPEKAGPPHHDRSGRTEYARPRIPPVRTQAAPTGGT